MSRLVSLVSLVSSLVSRVVRSRSLYILSPETPLRGLWAVYRPARVAVCGVEKHRVCEKGSRLLRVDGNEGGTQRHWTRGIGTLMLLASAAALLLLVRCCSLQQLLPQAVVERWRRPSSNRPAMHVSYYCWLEQPRSLNWNPAG